jgi:hypothetical protein
MRSLDDTPIDPEIAAELDAIDATLAGEPVDPCHAELAELALLLAAQRPAIDPDFAAAMDARVARRFGSDARGGSGAASPGLARRIWSWPSAAALAAGLAAVMLVVVIGSGGGGPPASVSVASSATTAASAVGAPSAAKAPSGPAVTRSTSAASSSSAAPASSSAAPASSSAAAPSSAAASSSPAATSSPAAPSSSSGGPVQAPAPVDNGRRTIQSAQLALNTPPNRVDDVAQEVFDVIGRESGIVRRSVVTATGGSDGYAEFELSVPSSSLQATMAALSRVPYANVASRTDTTQDVNDQYVSVQHQLADARALRTALLKQLATATTQQQIDSLNAQIHGAEASIASNLATLRGLGRQIAYSQISVTINAVPVVAIHHGGGSFTLGAAAHDAGRVLTVGAGVALIALAVLVPIGLLTAFVWWVGTVLRRRRREHALDVA